MVSPFRRAPEFISMVLAFANASAAAELETRSGFIECGGSHVRARAECYSKTLYCTSETLSFARQAATTIVPLHPHQSTHELKDRAKVRALDYSASSWACVPGKHGGRYLLVDLSSAGGGNCRQCEYSKLYDLNGRLIAASLGFDTKGRAHDHPAGEQTMRRVLGEDGRYTFHDVYR
jgi:hypothetical protein